MSKKPKNVVTAADIVVAFMSGGMHNVQQLGPVNGKTLAAARASLDAAGIDHSDLVSDDVVSSNAIPIGSTVKRKVAKIGENGVGLNLLTMTPYRVRGLKAGDFVGVSYQKNQIVIDLSFLSL